MRILPSILLGTALLLAGCDSGDDAGDDGSLSCADLGYQNGTASVTTPNGKFQGSCSRVDVSGPQIEVTVSDNPGLGDENSVRLLIRNFTNGASSVVAGTYVVGASSASLDGRATFYRGSSTTDAESGRIVVTTVTSSRIAGTFEFTSSAGATYTGGRFDVPL